MWLLVVLQLDERMVTSLQWSAAGRRGAGREREKAQVRERESEREREREREREGEGEIRV